METGLHHFCNREFCRALRDLRGYNFLLLLIDGSAVFGQIGRINDWVLGVLPPIGVPGVDKVLSARRMECRSHWIFPCAKCLLTYATSPPR